MAGIQNNNRIDYTYTATGRKLRKEVNHSGNVYSQTDYSGAFLYEDGELITIFTPAGRVIPMANNSWQYEYNLTDHLGNVRAVFSVNPQGQAVLQQKTDYYPFGMVMTQTNPGTSPENKLLYNSKEIQDDVVAGKKLDWYDYGARFYDPQIARFHSIDPLAENYTFQSPFVYAANNPIRYIDYMGMSAEEPDEEEQRRQQEEQAAQEAARQAEIAARVAAFQKALHELYENSESGTIYYINTTQASSGNPQNTQEKLIATGITLASLPEAKVSKLMSLGLFATAGVLFLWDKFVYDKDGKLDVSKLHYTYQPPSLNPIHNQPRNPQFNPGDWEGVIRWAIITSLGAGAIKDYYDQTTVKFPQPSTPINEPDKTRVSMPRP